ncbi:hypothetical protein [Streptomyces mirabilis]|uniref:hypothetical protein n=1 Tax=Streptomyces mirabilis TaxID=68239 RepID=UPI0036CAF608
MPHRAGPEPGEGVNPLVVQAMAEVGIDLTGRTTRHLREHTLAASDIGRYAVLGAGRRVLPVRMWR